MKKIFLMSLLAGGLAFAQVEPPTDPVDNSSEGAFAKPSTQQKKTVSKAAKKAEKAKAEEKTPAPVLNDAEVNPVPDKPFESEDETATKKVRKEADRDNIVVKQEEPAKPDGNLFGIHGDINVPHILNFGLDFWHSSKYFSVALNAGGYKVSNVAKSNDLPNGANIKISNQEAVFRYHPFAGSFYLGLGLGKHEVTLDGNRSVTVTSPAAGSADVAISDKVKANYVLPHVGWLWKTSFGMTFGMDLGYLSPSSSSVDVTTNISNISNPAVTEDMVKATDDYKNAYKKVVDDSEKYGKMGLPYWTVIRVGYMF